MIEVLLSKALICFAGQCHPVLVGPLTHTQIGVYEMVERTTRQPGYGGLILQYAETPTTVYAIHRVYPFDRNRDRVKMIKTAPPTKRRNVTMGCINVENEVFDALLKQPERTLVIKE